MKRTIELKHVEPKAHVRNLLEELIARLEEKLEHFPDDAVSLHVLFEGNGTHKLYRTSLTCHVPGHTVAAHEERRDAGSSIREAFAEVERQLEKQKALLRREHLRGRDSMATRRDLLLLSILSVAGVIGSSAARAAEQPSSAPSPKAVEAIQLLESNDPYERQLGFLRLEALREPGTALTIRKYLDHKDPEMRAYSIRALAAVDGVASVPFLLQRFKTEKSSRVRRAILLGVEPFQQQNPEILPTCLLALRDRDTEVRMTAVDLVSRVDDPRAREAIRLRNKREHRRDVRRVLALAMKRLKSR